MGAVGVDLASRVGGVVELKVILVVSKVLGLLHLHPHQRLTADHVGINCTTNVFRQVNRRGSSFALLEQQEVKLPAPHPPHPSIEQCCVVCELNRFLKQYVHFFVQ